MNRAVSNSRPVMEHYTVQLYDYAICMDIFYFCTMTVFQKRRIAREAIRKASEAEDVDRARKLIEAGELNQELIQKFLNSLPHDVEVRIYPAGGGQITLTRQRTVTEETFRPWDYQDKAVVNGLKR
jgi:hypothetical protein